MNRTKSRKQQKDNRTRRSREKPIQRDMIHYHVNALVESALLLLHRFHEAHRHVESDPDFFQKAKECASAMFRVRESSESIAALLTSTEISQAAFEVGIREEASLDAIPF